MVYSTGGKKLSLPRDKCWYILPRGVIIENLVIQLQVKTQINALKMLKPI